MSKDASPQEPLPSAVEHDMYPRGTAEECKVTVNKNAASTRAYCSPTLPLVWKPKFSTAPVRARAVFCYTPCDSSGIYQGH